MPIFVSRFSPERSLIGRFLAPRPAAPAARDGDENARRVTGAGNGVSARSGGPKQAEDRVDSANRTTPKTSTRLTSPNDALVGGTPSTSSQSNEAPDALTLLDQLRLRRSSFNVTDLRDSEGSSEEVEDPPDSAATQPTAPNPLASRLTQLVEDLRSDVSGETDATAAPAEGVVKALAIENEAANAAAATERLEGLLDALQSGEVVKPQDQEPAIAPPPIVSIDETRETQEQELRQDLQTIATGLRTDADIEGRRNAEIAARNADAASGRNQRQEVQQNQREIQSLQAERRQAQQEAQSADQSIRQLQTQNRRIQANSSGTRSTGNALDLLS